MNTMNSKFANNPMARMMNQSTGINTPAPAPIQNPQAIPTQTQQPAQINPAQFQQYVPNLNDNILSQLANQARQQGISEQDINNGLNFIRSLR